MTSLGVHAAVYVIVNAFLVAVWVLLGGDPALVPDYLTDLTAARDAGFWPVYVMLFWGLALAIHAAVVIVTLPRRLRRRRARRRRQARRDERSARAGANRRPAAEAAREPAAAGEGGPDRQWVVVLFTDIVDSTVLATRHGDSTWAALLAEHRDLVRSCVADHGGEEVGTQGDGFLVRFDHPAPAVACASVLRDRLTDERDDDPRTPEVRMGIHAGEVVTTDGDLIGTVVNLASRVTAVAQPGEILVTEQVADHLGDDVKLTDRGLHDLKGIDRPRHLLAVE